MKPFLETVTPEQGTSWAFLDRRLPAGIPFEWHQHPEFELTLTLNSRGYRYIGDDVAPYDHEDLVLVGPGIAHSWHSREALDPGLPHVALVAWFTRDWVQGLAGVLTELTSLVALLDRAQSGLAFSGSTRQVIAPMMEAIRHAGAEERALLLLQILTHLARDKQAQTLTNLPAPDVRLATEPRLSRVLDHLHRHFAEPLSVEDLAKIAYISPSGLHRLFRRQMRMTIMDYVIRLRIGKACALLLHQRRSIADIATEAGYTNLSLFNRQFAGMKGETPSAFRKRHRFIAE